ncbi:MAG: RloB domain-containing protein [Bacteroidales bacterium]|nr:RloB domain-containing protein [Bacteroidales bacterium]
MKRYGNYTRREGTLDSRLVIIAAEGECTEKIYFEALREYAHNSRVHIKILERDEEDKHNSSPEYVLAQLNQYKSENPIEQDDELWLVIDRDSWTIKSLKTVAQHCAQDPVYHLALSNPCFELWLILHKVDVALESEEEKAKMLENKKSGRNGDTYLKRKVRALLGNYSEARYEADQLVLSVAEAIIRAESLDKNKCARWPQELGTHVYKLAQSITKR